MVCVEKRRFIMCSVTVLAVLMLIPWSGSESPFALIVRAASTLAGGATRQVAFRTVHSDVPFSISSQDMTLEQRLTEDLENLKSSDIFNKSFMFHLNAVSFSITNDPLKSYEGLYDTSKHTVTLNIARLARTSFRVDGSRNSEASQRHDVDSSIQKYSFINLVHELLHYYWFTEMSLQQQDAFRNHIFHLVAHPNTIDKNGLYFRFYFVTFLARKTSYEKWYGNDFRQHFYGTEAFAYLMDSELSAKAHLIADLARLKPRIEQEKNPYKRRELENEYVAEYSEVFDFKGDGYPPGFVDFYKDCLSSAFFLNHSKDTPVIDTGNGKPIVRVPS